MRAERSEYYARYMAELKDERGKARIESREKSFERRKAMESVKLAEWKPEESLTTPEAQEEFILAAVEDGNPAFVAQSLAVVARARGDQIGSVIWRPPLCRKPPLQQGTGLAVNWRGREAVRNKDA